MLRWSISWSLAELGEEWTLNPGAVSSNCRQVIGLPCIWWVRISQQSSAGVGCGRGDKQLHASFSTQGGKSCVSRTSGVSSRQTEVAA
jgi:hypothetical protein